MNERINELAEQAGIVFWEISGDVDWRQANRETLEKFAELIVRECIHLVNNSQHQNSLDKYDEYFKGFNESLVFAQHRIKQHFGVNNEPTI